MKLRNNEYWWITFEPETSVMESCWVNTDSLTDQLFKEEMLAYADLALKYKPTYYLVNTVRSTYTMGLEIQEWVGLNVFPKTMHDGVRKFAIVIAEDLYAQVSISQAIEDAEAQIGQVPTRYFDTVEKARKWILNS
jgi:hypothetical protein